MSSFIQAYWPILVVAAMGAGAIGLQLPRVRRFPHLFGIPAGVMALGLAGWLLIRPERFIVETILFYAFAGMALLFGGIMITQTQPVRAALSFAMVVLSTCGLFLLQAAPFLMAATIIIYAGAIVVTFLFVIMLAQQSGLSDADYRSREPVLASVAGFVLLAAILCVLHRNYASPPQHEQAVQKINAYLKEIVGPDAALIADSAELQKRIEGYLKEIAAAAEPTSVKDLVEKVEEGALLKRFSRLVKPLEDKRSASYKNQLYNRLVNLQGKIVELDPDVEHSETTLRTVKSDLREIHRLGWRLQSELLGHLHPDTSWELSPFSGTPSNQPPPRDKYGKARMPAENVAAVGRSLFTDYLVAVELAATLLLVATIGAIAIAGRRTGELR